MSDRRASGDHGRFKSYKAEPERTVDLAADHPAVVEGRTLFPGTVKDVFESPRMLVSGENSPKTGGMITVGPWTDFPVYTLTLDYYAKFPSIITNSTNWLLQTAPMIYIGGTVAHGAPWFGPTFNADPWFKMFSM